jgi:integrase
VEGHLVQRGKSKTWYLVYDEPSRSGKRVQRWVSLKTKTKAEASKKKRELLGAAELPKIEARPTDLTGPQLFAAWLECRESTLAANTHIRYGTLTRSYAEPVIGPMLVADVRPVHIDRIYAAMRRQDLSERTCLHVHRAVHAASAFAVRYLQLVPENVVSRVQSSRVKPREMETFSLEQIRLILDAAAGSRLEVPIVTSALTGLRRGELLALKWSNVDSERQSIFVSESLEQTRRFGLRFKQPKSRSSRHWIPISDELASILQAHREKQKVSLRGFGALDDDLVFSKPDGTPWPPDTLTKQSRRCAA